MHNAQHNLNIDCVRGDITRQSGFDAVVNAANAQLRSGGGVAGAIHRAAGPELERTCRGLAPIKPGEAVITPGFRLPNARVIHCLGPVYGRDEPAAALLADCYRNALTLADEQGLESIAFPALSTGAFGYPMAEAAAVALRAVLDTAPALTHLRRVRFVLADDAALDIHRRTLACLSGGA